jgi:hypothetical protein
LQQEIVEMPNPRLREVTSSPVLVSRIEIERFKSVVHQEIDLKPLTAVVGVNSAGKSTFIQAMLMIVQHLQDEDSNEIQYSLNEHLVRLGTFAETLNNGLSATSADFRVALTLNFPVFGTRHERVTWDVTLGADESASQNSRFASVRKLRIAAQTRRHWRRQDSGAIVEGSDHERNFVVDDMTRPNLDGVAVLGDPEFVRGANVSAIYSDGTPSFAEYVYCRPGEQPVLYARYQLSEYLLEHVRRSFETARMRDVRAARRNNQEASSRRSATKGLVDAVGVRDVISPYLDRLDEELRELLGVSEKTSFTSDEPRSLEPLIEFPMLLDDFIFRVRPGQGNLDGTSPFSFEFSEVQPYFVDVLRNFTRNDDPTILGPVPTPPLNMGPPMMRNIKRFAGNALQKRAYYIGPIRDIDLEGDNRPWRKVLGIKGEHAALVLQREAREPLENPPVPPHLLGGLPSNDFQSVLSSWLQYLELAQAVEQEERGRLKPGIKVRPLSRSGTVPLTAVGVGVSQVLPVIMQCLLAAPTGSIVIVEQPELHLHPRIEVKLAEFFVACARTGRQIFIETHSEHLINRLRLEIARDQSGQTRELVSVLFASQDEVGATHYESAIINEFGGLEGDWPDKFIDLSTEESLALMKTALARRAKRVDEDDEYEEELNKLD